MQIKSTLLTLAAVVVLNPLVVSAQSFTGIISDSMCGLKHMMPGKSDAQCIRECVKAGSKYVLVVGNKSYTLSGKPETISAFAGQHVKVDGTLSGSVLSVQAIQAAH